MQLPVFLGFVTMALAGCGNDVDSPSGDATNGDDESEQQAAQPFQRSEQCAATFVGEPQVCTSTGSTIEQPSTVLPDDFPPMPSTARYCGDATDSQGTTGLSWAITGLPDDLQTFFATELAARGYRPTEVTPTGVRNCAEAISFSSATHTGFVAFSPGIVSVTVSSLPLR